MSPIRHEDDFRRREINDWDEYVQEEIEGAIARGEFDDLPDSGKPLKIWRTELNPEYDLAFSRLKNAGVLPAWMELDAEIGRITRDNEAFLERSRTYLLEQLEGVRQRDGQDHVDVAAREPWWRFWRRLAAWWRMDVTTEEAIPPVTIGDLIVQRDHMRMQYLERAATLDKKIAEYHNALPRELVNLQRLRMLPDRAARIFDERIPARLLVSDGVDADD